MIGSRLLSGGYGCGFKTRPLHAGFLGQDALLAHDEAHLEPAFQVLLISAGAELKRPDDRPPVRTPHRTPRLSAAAELKRHLRDPPEWRRQGTPRLIAAAELKLRVPVAVHLPLLPVLRGSPPRPN
jgi:CRISPR-associated helicase Cas3